MDVIVFNPNSRNGDRKKFIEHIKKSLKKGHHAVVSKNILDIDDVDAFLSGLSDDDRLIIVGGDGTIHRLVNTVNLSNIKQQVLMVRGGTGNDFLRSLGQKARFIPIQNHLKNLPSVDVNGHTYQVINGVGVGLDGRVGYYIEHDAKKKTKLSFFTSTLKAFMHHQPNSMTFRFSNKTKTYQRVWMASVMYGSTFGGGMKIAPKATRSDQLHVVIIKDCPKWLLFFIFPLIYIGKHVWFKSYVDVFETQDVYIQSSVKLHGEVDGELLADVSELRVKR